MGGLGEAVSVIGKHLLGNNLGLLGSAKQARGLLGALGALAAPGAQILARGTDPYLTDDPLHLAYHNWNRRRGRMPGQLRLRVRYRDLATDWFDYLFPSVEELRGLLGETGWELAECPMDGAFYLAVLRRTG